MRKSLTTLAMTTALTAALVLSAQARHRHHIDANGNAYHYHHSDGCSRAGDVAGINCQLRRWIHCSGGAVRVTSFNAHARRACPGVRGGYIIANKGGTCGRQMVLRNPSNGRSITAVVGDKGPATIAALDLSNETAHALGISGSGCVYVGGAVEARE